MATPKTWYAIQHAPTGFYLPEYGSLKGKRGHTHHEPTDKKPPRLFPKRHHADTALRWWLKGKHSIEYYEDDEGGYDEGSKTTHQESRVPDEMQVVEMVVIEKDWWDSLNNSENKLWHEANPERMGR